MMSKIKRENNFQCHFSRGQQLCANVRYDGNQEFEVISKSLEVLTTVFDIFYFLRSLVGKCQKVVVMYSKDSNSEFGSFCPKVFI